MALSDFDLAQPDAVSAPYLRPAFRGGLPRISVAGAPAAYGTPQPINLSTLFSNRSGGVPALPAIPALPGIGLTATGNGGSPLFSAVKSPEVQQATNTAFTTNANNQDQQQQSLTDFTRDTIASRGKVNDAGNQEQQSIDSIYGHGAGSIEQQLANLNRQRQAATNMAAQSAMGIASRANNAARLTNPNSSYLDRLFGQQLMNIGVNAAGQGADQSRADLEYLAGQRTGAIGRRQQIIDSINARDLAPAQAAQSFESANVNNVGNLAGIDYGNHTYTTPEDAVSRRLAMYDDLVRRGLAYYQN